MTGDGARGAGLTAPDGAARGGFGLKGERKESAKKVEVKAAK